MSYLEYLQFNDKISFQCGIGAFVAGSGSMGSVFNLTATIEKSGPLEHFMRRASLGSSRRLRSGLTVAAIVLLLSTSILSAHVLAAESTPEDCPHDTATSSLLVRESKSPDGGSLLSAAPAYPLKASANNRYLVDDGNTPFLMIGDAPQALIANASEQEASDYLANRKKYGFNVLWINLLCRFSEICREDGSTSDGIVPFTSAGDLSTPNAAYFERADHIISAAAENGMLVLLDPVETSSWLDVLRSNGPDKAFAFGQYLGERYRKFPNIIWLHGNDFQSWRNSADDVLVQAVARGIKSEDAIHLHTVELDFLTSGSLDDASWAPFVQLNAAYTYFPTYAQILKEYNRPNFKPVFLIEANYEFEHLPNTDGGSTQNLRRQAYWTMLSGATGLVYGSAYTWRVPRGWQGKLDSPGAIQLCYLKDLFTSRRWHDLVPDQAHAVVTSGYHGISEYIGKAWSSWRHHATLERHKDLIGGSVTANTFAPAARTPDGMLIMAYLPTLRTITVDMTKLAGTAAAKWFDPTNGRYVEVNGSPFANSGSIRFSPPGTNSSGDADWVFVLEVLGSRPL